MTGRVPVDDTLLEKLSLLAAGLSSEPDRKRACKQAGEIAYSLGNLARWWMPPELLELAAEAPGMSPLGRTWRVRPALPTVAGSCWVILAQIEQDEAHRYHCLRPAFLLPLRWVKMEQDKSAPVSFLPPGLEGMAGRVRDALAKTRVQRVVEQQWRLTLSEVDGLAETVDLTGLSWRYESAFFSLAGGLMLATLEGEPNPNIWATGAWDSEHGGTKEIGQLGAKIQLAEQEIGTGEGARKVYVPSPLAAAASKHLGLGAGGVSIASLGTDSTDLARVLQPYLEDLYAPPLRLPDNLEQRKNYYLLVTNPEVYQPFYRERLVPDIIEDCRSRVTEIRDFNQPGLLVTIVSTSHELISIAVGSLRPRNALVFHTTDKKMSDLAGDVVKELRPWSEMTLVEPVRFVEDRLDTDLPELTTRYARQYGIHDEDIVFDLTPGHKLMTLTLAFDAMRRRSWCLYLLHDLRYWDRKVVPLSQRPMLWRAEESWSAAWAAARRP